MKKQQNIGAVISLGGSLIAPDGVDISFVRSFRNLVINRVRKGGRFVIITGGGKLNRRYNEWAREIVRVSSADLDWIGIATTKLHAQFIRSLFGKLAFPNIIDDPTKVPVTSCPIIVGGGYRPGCSTDCDAVIIAKRLGLRTIVNLTDTKFVYDRDPKKFPNAKPLQHVSWPAYRKLIPIKWTPRLSTPFDPLASRLAEKYQMRVCIIKGHDLAQLNKAIVGRPFEGTLIGIRTA